jgi:tRNA1Val (adenine37-N6)-methyltransferase
MATPSFRFQQFEVFHDKCGMKVGTDGVLLGAWARASSASRILDVGTGSGLIALILAQRTSAFVTGVECDAAAAEQAAFNVRQSPWADRVRIVCSDFLTFQEPPFDGIVSNPPFFQQALHAPDRARNQARHAVALTHERLIAHVQSLLSEQGLFSVVLPFDTAEAFEDHCWTHRLYLSRRCDVSTVEGKAPKRVLLEFVRERVPVERTRLAVSTKEGARTPAFSALTSDLYLIR